MITNLRLHLVIILMIRLILQQQQLLQQVFLRCVERRKLLRRDYLQQIKLRQPILVNVQHYIRLHQLVQRSGRTRLRQRKLVLLQQLVGLLLPTQRYLEHIILHQYRLIALIRNFLQQIMLTLLIIQQFQRQIPIKFKLNHPQLQPRQKVFIRILRQPHIQL